MVIPTREQCLRMMEDADCEPEVIEHSKLVEVVPI